MAKRKYEDLGAAICLVITGLIFAYVYRDIIISWLEAKTIEFISGLVSAIVTFFVGLLELGVPLVAGWYIAEKLIETYNLEDWKVAAIGIFVVLVTPSFTTGYLQLFSIIGWGMGLNIFLRFLNSQNFSL